uniref:Putative dimethyladenosine transferase n=1 Tax=Magallana gigas TaxID=29159 RepID=K1PRP0_MAGGI
MPKVRVAKKSRTHQDVQKQGINFNKEFGQHILKNPLVVNSMIEKPCVLNLRLLHCNTKWKEIFEQLCRNIVGCVCKCDLYTTSCFSSDLLLVRFRDKIDMI